MLTGEGTVDENMERVLSLIHIDVGATDSLSLQAVDPVPSAPKPDPDAKPPHFEPADVDLNERIDYPVHKRRQYVAFFKRLGWLRGEVASFTNDGEPVPELLGEAVSEMLMRSSNDLRDSDQDDCLVARHASSAARRLCWAAGTRTFNETTGCVDRGSP